MNASRDLFLLAAMAYQQNKYDSAGSLFATAMNSEDVSIFLEQLSSLELEHFTPQSASSVSSSKALVKVKPLVPTQTMSLSSIIQVLSEAMESTEDDNTELEFDEGSTKFSVSSGEEDEDEDEDEAEDDDEAEDEDEADTEESDTDDNDPDYPGQTIIPSSISSDLPKVEVATDKPSKAKLKSTSVKTRPETSSSSDTGEAESLEAITLVSAISTSGSPIKIRNTAT